MKRLIVFFMVVFCFFLVSCNRNDIDESGLNEMISHSYEKKVALKGKYGEQYDKKTLKMVNIDGILYYDSGRASEKVHCGVLDGTLENIVKENEIPLKNGEANFISNGYQLTSNGTVEVNTDGKWLIFEKYDNSENIIDSFKYCYYIRGRLNNAAKDSELIVFSENDDITFNNVFDSLLSSQYPKEYNKGGFHYVPVTPDKWGISLQCKRITPSGMTLLIEQSGGTQSGKLETGYAYIIEIFVEGSWKSVKSEPVVWALPALDVNMNDVKEMKLNWENIYGKLSPGFYRIKKEIIDFRYAGDYDKKTYEAYFFIE